MKTLLALGAGALAMYLMDREQGAQRRAQLREKLDRAQRMIRERVSGSPAQRNEYAPELDRSVKAWMWPVDGTWGPRQRSTKSPCR